MQFSIAAMQIRSQLRNGEGEGPAPTHDQLVDALEASAVALRGKGYDVTVQVPPHGSDFEPALNVGFTL